MSKLDSATIEAIRAAAPNVKNGTFTISHDERGHYTLKLWTAVKGALADKRIISMLVGPDNTADYQAVAFWDDAKRLVFPWRRFRGAGSTMRIDGFTWQAAGWSSIEQKLAIWADLAIRGAEPDAHGFWHQEGYALLAEGRCCRCNRKLTHPESIQYGIGPECAKKGI